MRKIIFVFFMACLWCMGRAHAINNCTGATYYDSDNDTCIACPNGYDYNIDPGKTDISQCQIHCDAGTWTGEYTKLEYIESTGSQWINTRISEANIDYIELDFESSSGGYMLVNGSTQVAMNEGRYGTTSLHTRYQIKQERIDNRWYFTNISNDVTYTQPRTASSANLYLFALNSGSGSAGNYSKAKVYSLRCYSNGTLSYNLIPVRRNSDGILGMYDTVSGQFFTNSGTGIFGTGPDTNEYFGGVGECINVGAGYYVGASTMNFGSVGVRNACPAGLTTVGYGAGADEAGDCGHILHIGENVLYLRSTKKTPHALHFAVGGNGGLFFANATTADVPMHAGTNRRLKIKFNDVVYSIYDDTAVVPE